MRWIPFFLLVGCSGGMLVDEPDAASSSSSSDAGELARCVCIVGGACSDPTPYTCGQECCDRPCPHL